MNHFSPIFCNFGHIIRLAYEIRIWFFMVVALLSPSSGFSQVVHESQTDSSTAPIYNLQGQRLGTPQRGVNIVGGKKIIVK